MNRDMPSMGNDPLANLYRIAHLRREINRMKNLLATRTGNRNFYLRFRIKVNMINLRHELKHLK